MSIETSIFKLSKRISFFLMIAYSMTYSEKYFERVGSVQFLGGSGGKIGLEQEKCQFSWVSRKNFSNFPLTY